MLVLLVYCNFYVCVSLDAKHEMKISNVVKDITLNNTQHLFIRALQPKFQAFMGGIGNGKTTAGVIKADLIAESYPGSMGLIGRQDFTDLNRTTWREFFGWRPDLKKHYHGTSHILRYPNGSEILFSELSDLSGLLSLNLDWFYIDQCEETVEEAFLTLAGRLRGKTGPRIGFMSGNPAGHDYIWRRFKQRMSGGDYALFESPSQENEKNLPADYLPTLLANAPEAWIKRYVYGSWDAFEGLIWPDFVEAKHVIDPFDLPQDWERLRVIDHGYTNPTACLWGAVDWDGNIYIYEEHYQSGTSISEHAQIIKDKHKRFVGLTYIDPSCMAKTRERDGKIVSVSDEYMEFGINCQPANNDVRGGINRVGEYFRANRIKVFKNCTNLIRELGDYQWRKLKSALIGDKAAPEEPRKVNDHACDSLRYMVNAQYFHRPARGEAMYLEEEYAKVDRGDSGYGE